MGGSCSKKLIVLLFALPLTLGTPSSCNSFFLSIKCRVSFLAASAGCLKVMQNKIYFFFTHIVYPSVKGIIIVFASNVGLAAHSGQQTYKVCSSSKPSDPFELAFQRSSVWLLTGGWLLHSCKSFHVPGACLLGFFVFFF